MDATTFTEITERIESLPDFKWVDLEQGQLDVTDEQQAFDYPACFIGIEDIPWKTAAGRYIQQGDLLLNVRVAWKTYEETFKGSSNKAGALAKLGLLTTVFVKLQGFEGTYFNQLTRVRTFREKRTDGLDVYNIQFLCSITDNSAYTPNDEPLNSFTITKTS